MGMNAQIHLYLRSELFEKLKKEAENKGLPIATLCKEKLDRNTRLERIELILENIQNLLKHSNKPKLGGEKW